MDGLGWGEDTIPDLVGGGREGGDGIRPEWDLGSHLVGIGRTCAGITPLSSALHTYIFGPIAILHQVNFG